MFNPENIKIYLLGTHCMKIPMHCIELSMFKQRGVVYLQF